MAPFILTSKFFNKMKAMILRVVKCGEVISVKSEKSENGILNKRQLVLQELGG